MSKKRINEAINRMKEWTNTVYTSTVDGNTITSAPYTITTSGSSGDDYVWTVPKTITPNQPLTTTEITTSWPGEENLFEKIKNSFGVLYIEGDFIKVHTKSGKEITLAKIDEDDQIQIVEKILAVFAKESLIE